MDYQTLKQHFEDLLNRSDITSTLTTRFIDRASVASSGSCARRCPSVSSR